MCIALIFNRFIHLCDSSISLIQQWPAKCWEEIDQCLGLYRFNTVIPAGHLGSPADFHLPHFLVTASWRATSWLPFGSLWPGRRWAWQRWRRTSRRRLGCNTSMTAMSHSLPPHLLPSPAGQPPLTEERKKRFHEMQKTEQKSCWNMAGESLVHVSVIIDSFQIQYEKSLVRLPTDNKH